MDIKSQNVLDYHGNNAVFMVWNFKRNLEVEDSFKRICKLVINLNNSTNVRFPDSGASCVMGIGYNAWLDLHLPVPIPKELENFVPIVGEKHTAVCSKGDLHFHIRGNDNSACYDMAHAVSDVLEPVAISIEEIHSFIYWDGRSILGFVDGTENPQGQERAFFGLVGDDDLFIKEVVIFLFKNISTIYLHLKNYLLKNRKKYLAGINRTISKCRRI